MVTLCCIHGPVVGSVCRDNSRWAAPLLVATPSLAGPFTPHTQKLAAPQHYLGCRAEPPVRKSLVRPQHVTQHDVGGPPGHTRSRTPAAHTHTRAGHRASITPAELCKKPGVVLGLDVFLPRRRRAAGVGGHALVVRRNGREAVVAHPHRAVCGGAGAGDCMV
eukprot:365509-Chlamydomonas_euryale.AAC.22